ncbi:MAG: SDR family oxidoreductase [Calditrichaeota bacterium]|nr:MAG: SDR family oxidoreductase [Calditrichota bacterium]
MNNPGGKNVLITGGSSGIGYELSKLFARDGYNLILVARSKQRLQEIRRELEHDFAVSVKVISMDLSDPEQPIRLYEILCRENIAVHILVNNAGFGLLGDFRNTPLQRELELLRVNEMAPLILTKLFLPGMLERGEGRILNVASTAAFVPGPRMAVYYASKAHILSMSEALASELKDTGITVTVLCPGPTRTGFQKTAGQKGANVLKFSVMEADRVAGDGYRGLMRGKKVVLPGILNKTSAFFARYAPHVLTLPVLKYLHKINRNNEQDE